MPKAFKAFRFDPALYARFKELASGSGLTVTGAFERFMEACVNAGAIAFLTADRRGVEAEARVLLAWLRKGKWFYDSPSGEEEFSVRPAVDLVGIRTIPMISVRLYAVRPFQYQ